MKVISDIRIYKSKASK